MELFQKILMRSPKFIIIGILLVVAGVLLLCHDMISSKTRASQRHIRKAKTAICSWTYLGETQVWTLDEKEDKLFIDKLKVAMLEDLEASRKEGNSSSTPEYCIRLMDQNGKISLEYQVFTTGVTWVECGNGIYQSKGATQKFFGSHLEFFEPVLKKKEE